MPLISDKNSRLTVPTEPSAPPPPIPTHSAPLNTTFVDTLQTPRDELLSYISGSRWIVTYYSQILAADSGLSGEQLSENPVYQSYTKVLDMEMRVQQPLTPSQNTETNVMEYVGSSLLYPSIIPNVGDMFVADTGQGRLGVFRVRTTEKRSIFKQACYEITYGLDNDAGDKQADLEQKTVKTLYFRRDFLTYGQNPLVLESDNAALLNLEKAQSDLLRQYFNRFFSTEYQTLIVPGQDKVIYDHFLVNFLLDNFSTKDVPELQKVRRLNVEDDRNMSSKNLWTALSSRDITDLNIGFTRYGLVMSSSFSVDPIFNGVRYSGIHRLIYPRDPVLGADYSQFNQSKTLVPETLTPSEEPEGFLNRMVRAANMTALPSDLGDMIYPVTVDDYYVLSSHFYAKDEQQSVLETLVWGYFDNQAQDYSQLLETARGYYVWGALEQFYYVPVLLLLIRAALRGA